MLVGFINSALYIAIAISIDAKKGYSFKLLPSKVKEIGSAALGIDKLVMCLRRVGEGVTILVIIPSTNDDS